ncbi:IS110 family transposase [Photobacterium rosenbergii]|uniref:IS110 family transposase n=1 Tax=Photobacterium rosenbergii TaxID=294936 RepID=UPI001C98E97C|nr:IS110 family transposase [Photobacterium rosenbergii]MBY5949317.1 IS110 family transposase [Photobacterium rosenbergii]
MSSLHILGIDLGKHSFHLVGHDKEGREQLRKKFNRNQLILFLSKLKPTTIAFEACGGAHWLARKCIGFGHQVKLLPPQYVKPYVKGNKNDFIDASAIAEAASRPTMRFVAVKSEEAQIITAIHRVRAAFIKERTACMSRVGAMLLEFGLSLPTGHATMKTLFQWLAGQKQSLPSLFTRELQELHEHYLYLNNQIKQQDKKLTQFVERNELAQLLKSVPGIGDMTASLCLADINSPENFSNGRNMAAWLGLVPRQYSTGGKPKLLGVSKRGNKQLRMFFIHGARAVLSRPDKVGKVFGQWLIDLRANKPFNVAVVALANKLARIAWAVMYHRQAFRMTTI